MSTRISNEKVDELIEYLRGTCKSLNEACEDLFEEGDEILTEENHAQIDREIFRCSTCDWWFDVSDQADYTGEPKCESCFESEEEEDDLPESEDEED